MIFSKTHKFKSFLPPVITTTSGRTYVCPGWHDITDKIDDTMSFDYILSEVFKHWEQILPKETEVKPNYKIYEMVPSSKGDKEYDVTFDGTYWNCNCVGFGFRRTCKHVKQIKEKYGIIK